MNDKKKNNPEESALIAERRRKLSELRKAGNAFPNDFRRNALAEELHQAYGEHEDPGLRAQAIEVKVSGRMMVKRVMGKASFIKVQDRTGQIQIRLERDRLADGLYQDFKKWDVGDIIGASGTLFKTKTGELTVMADDVRLLTKSLRPLPEKFHGLADREIRYRQRYVDLIMSEDSRRLFRLRSELIAYIRAFLDAQDFLEVETPMMQTAPGGAIARPFTTHHKALDMQLYMRIAPELFLKRLVVGGFERVYEINRSFRNEGVSTQHNPEFTMLELYRAYADYQDLIEMIEALLRGMSESLLGESKLRYQGEEYDFSKPFARMTVEEAIIKYNPEIDKDALRDFSYLKGIADKLGIDVKQSYGSGKLQIEIFEKTCEAKLLEPIFITAYPTEVS
ncbi:MAG: lysine--tRNA ligase, partial [Gammaproteobacteria bacterium]